jgi:uncharacterized membrane protein
LNYQGAESRMFDTIFTFLLKYSPLRYEEGTIVFQSGGAAFLFIGLLLLMLALAITLYRTTSIYPDGRSRWLSAGLRILALVLIFLPLFEPIVMYPDIVPNENFLAVLVDNSDSMSIPDGSLGKTRADDAASVLFDKKHGILPDLSKTFNVRYYTFSDEAARVDSLAHLIPNGHKTNLTAALRRVKSDFRGLPLAGIVLLTDGGDNSSEDVRSVAEELHGLGIPVHIVGLGSESMGEEREILSVNANSVQAEGVGTEITVQAKSWAKDSQRATIAMYQGNKLVLSHPMTLTGKGAVDTESLYFWPEERGVAQYTVQITPIPGEVNIENNSTGLLIDTAADSVRILYVEGYLRTDFKFIKRALEDDQILEFASALRTGTGKYYRQGIHAVGELSGGFPTNEEELNGYKAIIFGDIEANYFSLKQMEMVERFVSRRGGGFLMLGGRHSFAEGEYFNTPIADILPVKLDIGKRKVIPENFENPGVPEEEQGFRFVPTRTGLENPIMKLANDLPANRSQWDDIPRLTTINHLGAVKSGATVLAEKPQDAFGGAESLLIIQRYGRGRTAALATASTWRWRMMLDDTDTRHERFWRQLVRWLSTDAPDKVNIELADASYEPGDELPLQISVYDSTYNPVNNADVTGRITDPYGEVHEISLFPDLSEDGKYTGSYVLENPGVYSVEVAAKKNAVLLGTKKRSVLSYSTKKEFHDAVLKKSYLETIARINGGVYYEPSKADAIPAGLQSRRSSSSIFHYDYIWDSPLLFILIVIVLSVEWVIRRNRGLP